MAASDAKDKLAELDMLGKQLYAQYYEVNRTQGSLNTSGSLQIKTGLTGANRRPLNELPAWQRVASTIGNIRTLAGNISNQDLQDNDSNLIVSIDETIGRIMKNIRKSTKSQEDLDLLKAMSTSVQQDVGLQLESVKQPEMKAGVEASSNKDSVVYQGNAPKPSFSRAEVSSNTGSMDEVVRKNTATPSQSAYRSEAKVNRDSPKVSSNTGSMDEVVRKNTATSNKSGFVKRAVKEYEEKVEAMKKGSQGKTAERVQRDAEKVLDTKDVTVSKAIEQWNRKLGGADNKNPSQTEEEKLKKILEARKKAQNAELKDLKDNRYASDFLERAQEFDIGNQQAPVKSSPVSSKPYQAAPSLGLPARDVVRSNSGLNASSRYTVYALREQEPIATATWVNVSPIQLENPDKIAQLLSEHGLEIRSGGSAKFNLMIPRAGSSGEAKAFMSQAEENRLKEATSEAEFQVKMMETMVDMVKNVMTKCKNITEIGSVHPYVQAAGIMFLQRLNDSDLVPNANRSPKRVAVVTDDQKPGLDGDILYVTQAHYDLASNHIDNYIKLDQSDNLVLEVDDLNPIAGHARQIITGEAAFIQEARSIRGLSDDNSLANTEEEELGPASPRGPGGQP